jgi:hypothetical protein
MLKDFKFKPYARVVITFNDLRYRGRILNCIYDGGMNRYEVDYSDDKGDLKTSKFFEDELKEETPYG